VCYCTMAPDGSTAGKELSACAVLYRCIAYVTSQQGRVVRDVPRVYRFISCDVGCSRAVTSRHNIHV
jgi:hypothetical protein